MSGKPDVYYKEAQELLLRDHTLKGGICVGIEGHIVDIQARATAVLRRPRFFNDKDSSGAVVSITGMARGAIAESLDRIQGAFLKMGIAETPVKIIVNLSPASLPKSGAWLDLPIAIILLQAAGYLPDITEKQEDAAILMGEIGLHGDVRRVPGALAIAFAAKPGQRIIVPCGNEKECSLVKLRPGLQDCNAYPVKTLQEVYQYYRGKGTLESATKERVVYEAAIDKATDFAVIRGQAKAKEAALICAAGGHNLLMIGPPGEGKSLIAGAIAGILPSLSNSEKAELTCIYSSCGKLERDSMAVTRRPVRAVASSASTQALVGGGSGVPKPGEITLAHLGVLFMDEFPEFSRSALESLRYPMEEGKIRISRTDASLEFPARFTLVAAMNPCPCGLAGYGDCQCRERDVQKYQTRISGPILDRIDLQVELERLSTEERFAEPDSNCTSAKMKAIAQRARDRQAARFEGTNIPFNAAIPGGETREYCNFSEAGFARYKELVEQNNMSTRAMGRLAKVSRTVADIANVDFVEAAHVDKAASFVIGGILRSAFN
ncbi:MAG: YifB family Mg chelatase-like AAA ATPase [Thermoguttaceae bacterium]|nr:YifB family Mg chelatase-like AAA ATPase [Thermoguttaceae bacterium]